ncbi:MAG: hypothetical protein WBL70_08875 [Candidatus Acidiferrales bacterium]
MRGKFAILGLAVALSGGTAGAQQGVKTPIPSDMYCSGIATGQAPPRDTYLITGEGSDVKITFQEGDYVYVNKGAGQGVHVGDQFSIIRAVDDPTRSQWFKWQFSLMHAIGTLWEDEGRVKVIVVQPNISIAQIENSCEYLQRGDIAVPFVERVAPPLKPEDKFDRFAPPSGKSKAMLVVGKHFQVAYGVTDIAYVNLGEGQGVHVGDYFRIFRYTGQQNENAYQTRNMAFDVFGYGGVSNTYKWDNVPREVLGEGIVLRTSQNASTILITFALRDVYAGDYVELE